MVDDERIEHLEEQVQSLRETLVSHDGDLEELAEFREDLLEDRDRYREQVIQPQLEELREQRDDAREERAELKAQVEMLTKRNRELEAKLDSVIGLAEDETGGPEKRKTDLRMGLIRRAEAKSDANAGRAAMHWKDVQHFFADQGYGEVVKPLCYDAMEDAACADGFQLLEDGKQKDGRDVRAVAVDLEELPDTVGDVISSGATTGETTRTASNAGDTEEKLTSD